VHLGEVVVMASQALLSTVSALKASTPKRHKKAKPKRACGAPSLPLGRLIPDTAALVALLPDQACPAART
jgi:hypothetical protein